MTMSFCIPSVSVSLASLWTIGELHDSSQHPCKTVDYQPSWKCLYPVWNWWNASLFFQHMTIDDQFRGVFNLLSVAKNFITNAFPALEAAYPTLMKSMKKNSRYLQIWVSKYIVHFGTVSRLYNFHFRIMLTKLKYLLGVPHMREGYTKHVRLLTKGEWALLTISTYQYEPMFDLQQAKF